MKVQEKIMLDNDVLNCIATVAARCVLYVLNSGEHSAHAVINFKSSLCEGFC